MKENRFKDEREREVLLVTYDYCVLGLRGEKLAKHRHLTPATLARRLKQAREAGYIREAVLNLPPAALEDVYPYLYRVDLMDELHDYIGRENLRSLIVVPSASDEEKTKSPYINALRVGSAAGVRLLHLLDNKEMKNVGISYGWTLRHMIDSMQENVTPNEKSEWIPVFGDFLLTPFFNLSSSILAADLARIIRGEVSKHQVFLATPAYIPQGFIENPDSEEAERRMRIAGELVKAIPAYKQVFGASDNPEKRDPDALIAKMDTIITGIGGFPEGWLFKVEGTLPGPIFSEEEKKKLEDEGVVGDLCGTFITDNKVDGFPRDSTIARVNRRVFGPKPPDFLRCAEQARQKNTPGVIVVANGARKARVVASAISNRCLTELICDANLAEELAKVKGIKIGA
jgi:DNA-binding transcriptional regulator LsrR (DeoR family)